jgi:hypothetical protein
MGIGDILLYAKDANLPITAVNCTPFYSEKKQRVTKGDTKVFVGWNKTKAYSKKFIEYVPFTTNKAKPTCFMMDLSTSDLFVIDIDVKGDKTAKESLKDENYEFLLSHSKYAVETGSKGIHFYFKKGEDFPIRTKTSVEQFNAWFKEGVEGGVDIITNSIITEGSSYTFGETVYEYRCIITGSSINNTTFNDEVWELLKPVFVTPKTITNDCVNRSTENLEIEYAEIKAHLLTNIPNTTLDWWRWYGMGQAIFNEFDSDGKELFVEWSKLNPKYNEVETYKLWKGLRYNEEGKHRTIASILYESKKNNDEVYNIIRAKYKPLNYTICKQFLETDLFFIEEPTPRFVRETERGIVQYTLNDFKILYADFNYQKYDEDTDKIKICNVADQWVKDPRKRRYKSLGYYPDKSKCPADVYNTFMSAEASFLELELNCNVDLSLILNHIYLLSGEDKTGADFIIDFLAQIVQQPAIILGIALLFYGEQGAGKDILFHWFGKEILGYQQYYFIGNASNLFKSFNADLAGKTFILSDEVNKQTLYNYRDDLKRLITGLSIRMEKKGVDAVSLPWYARFIFTTNNRDSLNIESSDRRYTIFEASSKMLKDLDYFNRLGKNMEDPRVIRAFYDFLMKRDISKFNHTNRPKTKLYKEMREASMDSILKWINEDQTFIDNLEPRRLTTDYMSLYNSWAVEMGFSKLNITSFGRRLNTLIDKNIGISKTKPKGISYLEINREAVNAYLIREELA